MPTLFCVDRFSKWLFDFLFVSEGVATNSYRGWAGVESAKKRELVEKVLSYGRNDIHRGRAQRTQKWSFESLTCASYVYKDLDVSDLLLVHQSIRL